MWFEHVHPSIVDIAPSKLAIISFLHAWNEYLQTFPRTENKRSVTAENKRYQSFVDLQPSFSQLTPRKSFFHTTRVMFQHIRIRPSQFEYVGWPELRFPFDRCVKLFEMHDAITENRPRSDIH